MSNLNRKITAIKSKHLLVETELNKLKTFDFSYFISSHFKEDGVQNYLVFQPTTRYFKVIGNTNMVSSWKSKGLSAETTKPPITSDISLSIKLFWYKNKIKIYWKLIKTINNFICSWHNSKYLHCL